MQCCECGSILVDEGFQCSNGACCEECYDEMDSDKEEDIAVTTPPRIVKPTKYDVLELSDSDDETYISEEEGDDISGDDSIDEGSESEDGDDDSEDDVENETEENDETDETEDEQAFSGQIFW